MTSSSSGPVPGSSSATTVLKTPCSRSLCLRLSVPAGITTDAVRDALTSRFGADAILGVQLLPASSCVVAFASKALHEAATAMPSLDVAGVLLDFQALDADSTLLSVDDLPFWVDWATLVNALLPYGDVLDRWFAVYPSAPSIRTGTRKLRFRLKAGAVIPNLLMVNRTRVRVYYPGVAKMCYRCKKPGHFSKSCPSRPPPPVVQPVDPVQAASEAMPPPALQKSAGKRKHVISSPVPAQSPSPRSRKRQHVQTPDFTNAGKTSTPKSSPRSRKARSTSSCSSRMSESPTRCSPAAPSLSSPTALAKYKADFHQHVLNYYILKDDEGMFLRPNITARWIHRWCKSCWMAGDAFRPDDCVSSPKCDGRYVSDLGLPTIPGRHLFCLQSDGNQPDMCFFDGSPKDWKMIPILDEDSYHHGIEVPEYASAPTRLPSSSGCE